MGSCFGKPKYARRRLAWSKEKREQMQKTSRIVEHLNPTETTPLVSQEQEDAMVECAEDLLYYVYDQNVPNEYK